MRITSDIAEYPQHFIQAACKWHAAETGVDSNGCIKTVHVTEEHPKLRGEFVVWSKFRLWQYSLRKGALTLRVEAGARDSHHGCDDRTEMLLYLLWWALFNDSKNRKRGRAKIKSRIGRLMKMFRADRENILECWYCPPRR